MGRHDERAYRDSGDGDTQDTSNRMLMYAVAFYFIVSGARQLYRFYRQWRPAPAPGPAPAPAPAPAAEGALDHDAPAAAAPLGIAPESFLFAEQFDRCVAMTMRRNNRGPAGMIVLLVTLALLAAYLFAPADVGDELGLDILGKEHSLHLGKLAVPYYMRSFFVDSQGSAIPIADCAYHALAEQVQHAVLGELPQPRKTLALTDESSGDFDMGLAGDVIRATREAQAHRDELLLRRRRALHRCGLNAAYAFETASAAPSFEAHVTRPPFWEAKRVPLLGDDTRAASVIVARNGSRYFAVAAVRQPAGSASYRLMPSLVAERDLLATAELWDRQLTALAGASLSRSRCLCVAHLGIVNSGLHFWFDRGEKRWRLFSAVEIKFNQSFYTDKTQVYWPEHPLAFPAVVDGRYGVRELRHASKINILYYDETSYSDAVFVRAAQEVDGSWPAGPRNNNNSTSAFAIVLPLNQLTPVLRFIDDKSENACMQHCLAIDALCAERLAAK